MGDILSQIPIVGGLFDSSQDDALNQLRQNQDLYRQLQTPNLTASVYNPEEYQYQTVSQDPTLRAAQNSYLSQLAGLANTGVSDIDKAQYGQAADLANQQMRSANNSALQNAQARGVAGGGMEYAMRSQGDQDALQRANQSNLATAGNAAQMRALYGQAYGNQANNMQNAATGLNAQNAGIINQFNQMNTAGRNQAQMYNQQLPNQIAQQNYQNQMSRINGMAGANTAMAGGYAAENAANNSARNSNTQLAATAGMGLAGYGPMAARGATGGGGGGMGFNWGQANNIGADQNGSFGNKYSLYGD